MRVREQLVSLDDDNSEMNELDFSNTYCSAMFVKQSTTWVTACFHCQIESCAKHV